MLRISVVKYWEFYPNFGICFEIIFENVDISTFEHTEVTVRQRAGTLERVVK